MFSQVYCFGPESRGQEYKQHRVRQPSPEACLIAAPRDPIVSGFLSADLSSVVGRGAVRRQAAPTATWGAGAPVWAAGASGVWAGAGVPPAGEVRRLAGPVWASVLTLCGLGGRDASSPDLCAVAEGWPPDTCPRPG